MRILIVGAGALGGYFGARLLAAGRDVTFLVRARSAALLAEHGLRVQSPFGDVTLPAPRTVTAASLTDGYGLILFGPKAYDLDAALADFSPAAGAGTLILPLLNGLSHLDALDRRFNPAHVLGGLTDISAARDPATGVIHHLNRLHTLMFGPRPATPDHPQTLSTARLEELTQTLTVPGFDALLRPAILEDMWAKWVTITTAAGATCLLRAAIADIVTAGATPVVHHLLAEAALIATYAGFPPTPAQLAVILDKFTRPGSPFTASILRDLESGGAIESQHIIGDLLVYARAHRLATPLLDLVHAHLRCYEARREREQTTS